MKPKYSAALILIAAYALLGCAVKPVNAPSTAAVQSGLQAEREAMQTSSAKAGTANYKEARALEYFQ